MISDLVEENLILLDVEAADWETAIRKAALPLKEQAKIKQAYIDKIVESMKESGPYFVILPHVALPHARPEGDMVSESAMGITVLRNPVEFGNAGNDPVKYLFTLSAKDDTSHLGALTDLAKLLENETFFKVLDEAKNPHEVMNYLSLI